jgi:hypothetical protein
VLARSGGRAAVHCPEGVRVGYDLLHARCQSLTTDEGLIGIFEELL